MGISTAEDKGSSVDRQVATTPGRNVGWGLAAGVIGLRCCVYPTVLALLGPASLLGAVAILTYGALYLITTALGMLGA